MIFVTATEQTNMNSTGLLGGSTTSSGGSFQSLRYRLGKMLSGLFPIIQMFAVTNKVKPECIEIGYGENVTIEIGAGDAFTGGFDKGKAVNNVFINRFISFEIVGYPGETTSSSWAVSFNPPVIQSKEGEELKAWCTISLTAPPNSKNAIQNGILQIKVIDTFVWGNLWWPKNVKGFETFFNKTWWLFGAIFGGYGKMSGTATADEKVVDVLVRVKPYHAVRFDASPLKTLDPGQITTIPIRLQNLGNYNDTYSFRIANETDKIKLSDPLSITLKPGEIKDTFLGVAVSPNVLDTGTIHAIKIETYSIDQPNVTIAEKTVLLETKGIFLSDLAGAGVALFLILVFVAIVAFLYRRRRILTEFCTKPEKPWDIPEEKQYLDELKKEDNEKYITTLNDMRNEYQSSLLWYKHYRKAVLKEIRKKSSEKFSGIFKRSKSEDKATVKEFEKKKQQISVMKKDEEIKPIESEPEIPKKEERIVSVLEKSRQREQQRKERALRKIIKAQEKQKRKIGK